MAPIRFGVVGSGWRAEFFVRMARVTPERFQGVGVVTRSAERGAQVEREGGRADRAHDRRPLLAAGPRDRPSSSSCPCRGTRDPTAAWTSACTSASWPRRRLRPDRRAAGPGPTSSSVWSQVAEQSLTMRPDGGRGRGYDRHADVRADLLHPPVPRGRDDPLPAGREPRRGHRPGLGVHHRTARRAARARRVDRRRGAGRRRTPGPPRPRRRAQPATTSPTTSGTTPCAPTGSSSAARTAARWWTTPSPPGGPERGVVGPSRAGPHRPEPRRLRPRPPRSDDGVVVYRNPYQGARLADDDIAVATLLDRHGAWA